MKTLGIDLGTNSLGWCVIETDGEPGASDSGRILGIGARIFPDGREPKSGTSLAVERRMARAMRRRRDRYLRRREALLRTMTEYGLMPAEHEMRKKLLAQTRDGSGGDLNADVYALRARALDEALEPYQVGRIIFQLSQRRGFKSNRKTDGRDNEAGKIATGVARLEQAMMAAGARTYGEFLHKRRLSGQSIRTRLRAQTGDGATGDGYDFYPSRAALEHEFAAICAAQARHHPDLLSEDHVAHLRSIIFHQRPLAKSRPGYCSYDPNEIRLPRAHPLFQAFRLYKEVNELEVIGEDQRSRKLTPEERDRLVMKLRSTKTAGFDSLRKVLKLGAEFRFNKQSESRTGIAGDEICSVLSNKKCFGPRWSSFDDKRQAEVIERLRETENSEALLAWLVSESGLDEEHARAVADVHLPEGYSRIGPTAASNLLDAFKNEIDENGSVITEAEAARRCGYDHSDKSDLNYPGSDFLTPYQEILTRHIPPGTGDPDDIYDLRMGRITNPTVHIGLNQLRRVVNAIIRRHGKPDRIAIELGRDLKLNDKQKRDINQRIARNTRDAERRSEKLVELGQPDTGYNRLRLKLWEELSENPMKRVCVYTGEIISPSMAFTAEVDVDHILPFSQTLDDGEANKILCLARANRQKRNRAPADVPEWRNNYEEILARAGALPANKRWRFAQDAMKRFEGERDFLARQLTDMQYVSRMALTYLGSLYPTEEADADGLLRRHSRVRALPGRMTEMLRRNWGLNDLLHDHNYAETVKVKNRSDHRHHAIDAAVIAATSRPLIHRIATAAGQLEAEGVEKVVADIPTPWEDFRDELREQVNAVVVSHKPDHGTVSRAGYAVGKGQTAAKLHNETAYGPTGETDEKGSPIVVRRRPLTDIKTDKDLQAIRDTELRNQLWEATRGLSGKDYEAALLEFSNADRLNGRPNPFRGLRRVRVLETLKTIPISDSAGKIFKGFKGDSNYRYDVWRLPDGKWIAEVISTFDAHQPGTESEIKKQYPTAKKVLRLHQNDLLAITDPDKGDMIVRVVKFRVNGQITLAGHSEAGDLKRRDEMPIEPDPNHKKYPDQFDPFKYLARYASRLRDLNARQVRIDEVGQVFDPGPLD